MDDEVYGSEMRRVGCSGITARERGGGFPGLVWHNIFVDPTGWAALRY
jgi:hypothetical protein